MKRTRAEVTELQISNFIKEPENLKLLILAGTQLQETEFRTIRLCINLIKLDLSSNNLRTIPPCLTELTALKILFLHNNLIEGTQSLNIRECQAEYVTLFGNPVKMYRRYLISNLPRLKGVDFNMVCGWEKAGIIRQEKNLPGYTEVKWPIVELESGLENEVDYLNLLKAEVFVLNNVHMRSSYSELIEKFMRSIGSLATIDGHLLTLKTARIKHDTLIRSCAEKWMQNTKIRKRAREIVEARGKPHLMYNRIEYKRYLRSPEANRIIRRYVDSVKARVRFRKVLLRNLLDYGRIVEHEQITEKEVKFPMRLYIHKSQLVVYEKVLTYVKRYLFRQKLYDLCDDFDKYLTIDSKASNELLVVRQRADIDRGSSLLTMVAKSMKLVLVNDYTHRKNQLYSRKGHNSLIKFQNQPKWRLTDKQSEHFQECYSKLSRLYDKYDRLLELRISNFEIYSYFRKIQKCFNNGGQIKILRNVAAYFNTEVPDPNHIDEQYMPFVNSRLEVYKSELVDRARATVAIQKWWRSRLQLRRLQINTITDINRTRAAVKLQRWARSLTFHHRVRFSREYRFFEKTIQTNCFYLPMFVYLRLPQISDYLRLNLLCEKEQTSMMLTQSHEKPFRDLYELLHRDTRIRLTYKCQRQWLRIEFATLLQAKARIRLLTIYTYRFYYNGHSIRLLTLEQILSGNFIEYERRLRKSFRLIHDPTEARMENRPVDNPTSIFIVEEGNQALKAKVAKLPFQVTRRVRLNMFVLNTKKRPLKVQCQFNITLHSNMYLENQLTKQFSIRQQPPNSSKEFQTPEHSVADLYAPKPGANRLRSVRMTGRRQDRNMSLRESPSSSPDNKLGLNSLRLISETISFKKK